MNILFDFLYIVNADPAGIKKYGFRLLEGLSLFYTKIDKIGILCHDNVETYIRSNVSQSCQFVIISTEEKRLMCKSYTDYRCHYPTKTNIIEQYDIVISPCANYPLVIFSPYVNQIGVIHDLQMLKLIWKGKNIFRDIYYIIDVRRRIKKLDNIVTISRKTSKAVFNYTGRISHIIYNAVEPSTEKKIRPFFYPFSSNNKYILDVNTFYHYKNADVLIKAFSNIHEQIPEYRLYFKGNYLKEYERLPRLAERLGVKEKVYFDLEIRSEEEMSWLYANASIFVSPSLMEGFGLTPIEAINHGIPVIASNIDTIKEVVMDCATLFNPRNSDELAGLLLEEIYSPTSQKELNRRKEKMIEYYSVNKQISRFAELIESINN